MPAFVVEYWPALMISLGLTSGSSLVDSSLDLGKTPIEIEPELKLEFPTCLGVTLEREDSEINEGTSRTPVSSTAESEGV